MDSNNKRARPASEDEKAADLSGEAAVQEMKRARRVSAEDYLFNILEDEEDGGSESPGLDDDGGDNLASVMHSLEQEIRSGAGGVVPEEEDGDNNNNRNNEVSVQQLGYLLEASDDELGLPPAAEEESPSAAALARDVAELAGADATAMYGQMWGFDEEIGFGSEFAAFRPESSADEGFGLGLGFDDVGLFDHSEPSDLSWRTMPAV